MSNSNNIIIAITGASGVIYGIRLLEELKKIDARSLLILSHWAKKVILEETDYSVAEVEDMADVVYSDNDLAAPISSGSFLVRAMVIAPCTMKTLAGIATGFTDNLILRAADVTLKEARRLILVPRESPFHQIHLRNMLTLASMGAIIAPPIPSFYTRPETIGEIVGQTAGRIIDLLGLDASSIKRWRDA